MKNVKFLTINSNNPYVVLTLEEIILKDKDVKDDILYFYQNDNSIIIGRNQNSYEEVNLEYAKSKDIKIYRRISGGGAVYQDMGNICFSYITHNKGSYETFLAPVIEFLQSLGLNAEFKGRNDIQVDGFKISGNSQFLSADRMVHHGTILFDINIDTMQSALHVNPLKIQSKGIKSIRQRVNSIKNLLNYELSAQDFFEKLVSFFVKKFKATPFEINTEKYALQWAELVSLRQSEEWIFGKNPNFKVKNELKFDNGIIAARYTVAKNVFAAFQFEGDYLSKVDTQITSDVLVGVEYSKQAVESVLSQFDLDVYFGGIKMHEILQLIFGNNDTN